MDCLPNFGRLEPTFDKPFLLFHFILNERKYLSYIFKKYFNNKLHWYF